MIQTYNSLEIITLILILKERRVIVLVVGFIIGFKGDIGGYYNCAFHIAWEE